MQIELDVSMLEPCEPLEQTLEAIKRLNPGDYLHVLHRREPHLLYPLLEKSGYSWRCLSDQPGRYDIFIWRTDDIAAAREVDTVTP